MKYVLILFGEITSISFALGTVYLASKGLDGWGWCIVASILTTQSFKIGKEK